MKLLFSFFVIVGLNYSVIAEQVKYKTYFGECPSRVAGNLTMNLIKTFEKNRSLKDLKSMMVEEKLAQKHFISDYKISFDPVEDMLKFNLQCPKALMKVQIYKESGSEGYDAILVDNGELYDPTYETILRTESKLSRKLPFLAIPVGQLDKELRDKITEMMKSMDQGLGEMVSEVILDEEKELTIILSVNTIPSSVFLGQDDWIKKVEKLTKIVGYMKQKDRVPAVINLMNAEKVVVKFSDKF